MTDLERLLAFLDKAKIPYFEENMVSSCSSATHLSTIITEIATYTFEDGSYLSCWKDSGTYRHLEQSGEVKK